MVGKIVNLELKNEFYSQFWVILPMYFGNFINASTKWVKFTLLLTVPQLLSQLSSSPPPHATST
jgi:hypothetical protein